MVAMPLLPSFLCQGEVGGSSCGARGSPCVLSMRPRTSDVPRGPSDRCVQDDPRAISHDDAQVAGKKYVRLYSQTYQLMANAQERLRCDKSL